MTPSGTHGLSLEALCPGPPEPALLSFPGAPMQAAELDAQAEARRLGRALVLELRELGAPEDVIRQHRNVAELRELKYDVLRALMAAPASEAA